MTEPSESSGPHVGLEEKVDESPEAAVLHLNPQPMLRSPSAVLLASTTIVSEVTSPVDERKLGELGSRIALSLDGPQAPALQALLTNIEKNTRLCAIELINVS